MFTAKQRPFNAMNFAGLWLWSCIEWHQASSDDNTSMVDS